MLIEKEIIGPGTYWYADTAGLPRKFVATPEFTKYLHDQGNNMLSLGLTVPVPFEHDFDAHPMTPKDKLLNNAGEVKEYRLKDNVLFGVVDVQDPDAKRKIGHSIRWTSPWINSFTDGDGRKWNNVISHLALTTRPRITKQAPFSSIPAALSIATDTSLDIGTGANLGSGEARDGFFLSKAGKLVKSKKNNQLRPQYPMAFSIWAGGIKLSDDDMPPPKDKKSKKPKKDGASGDSSNLATDDADSETDDLDAAGDVDTPDSNTDSDIGGLMNPLQDSIGDVKMEELLCDLLTALGIQMPDNVGESEFKRALYEAAMTKIKELSAKGQSAGDANAAASAANTTSPAGGAQQNPIIQQEQQPMYMSLEEINKISDTTMKSIALSMYNENVKLRAEADTDRKKLNSLNDAKLKEENSKRQARVQMLGKLSPKVKVDLESMLALPTMALAMGEGGEVIDPMAHTLSVLEKGLADMPRLLITDSAALSMHPQPTDDEMSQETIDKTADNFARMMGCPPEQKAV